MMWPSSSVSTAPDSSSTGSMPTLCTSRLAALSNSRMIGPKTRRSTSVEPASVRATASGLAIARFLGPSSPSTIWITVESTKPVATASDAAVPRRQAGPDSTGRARPRTWVRDVADAQGRDRDPQLRRREHERQAPHHRQRAARLAVAGLGHLLQAHPAGSHQANSAATQYPVRAVSATTARRPTQGFTAGSTRADVRHRLSRSRVGDGVGSGVGGAPGPCSMMRGSGR